MNANKTVTAVFAPAAQYTLSVSITPSDGGTVSKTPDQTHYAAGTVVTLAATPAAGYAFSQWQGDATGSTNPTTITMNANKTVTAVFAPAAQYTLSVSITPSDGGTVSKIPDQTRYAAGTVVQLHSEPAAGCTFSHWEGDGTGTDRTLFITMDANKTVTAVFTVGYTLSVSITPSDGGTVSKIPDQTRYAAGTVVQLHSEPAAGCTFSHWEGDGTGTDRTLFITMDANKTVTAVFTVGYTLSVSITPSDGGTVSKIPDQTRYAAGTVVQLHSEPAAGCTFSHWEGDGTGTDRTLFITMDANKTVTAVFTVGYTLSVSITPSDGGTVSKIPDQTRYAAGTVVQLHSEPAAGCTFSHWEGDGTGTDRTLFITMDANKTVTAVFTAGLIHPR